MGQMAQTFQQINHKGEKRDEAETCKVQTHIWVNRL